MNKAIEKVSTREETALAIEKALVSGDLASLSTEERMVHFKNVCDSQGLNYLTNPFSYIVLNKKLVLYANKGCAEQLRRIHKVSLTIPDRSLIGDVYVVTVRATMGSRTDESTGAVNIKGIHGEGLANAYLKCETKAKRRVTLSICGMNMLDATEAETIPGAVMHDAPVAKVTSINREPVGIDPNTDEVVFAGDIDTASTWHARVTGADNADNVRAYLAEAQADLDTDEFQELQIVASEHLEFIGEES